MKLLSGADFRRLESAVQSAELRQQVISDNVANVDTPNFKRSEVLFEDLLTEAMGTSEGSISGFRTNAKHIPIGQSSEVPAPIVVQDETSSINNNGNNVDIDREMSLLAKNQLAYNLYIQQVNHDVSMMKTAIDGRV
ncbi:flagellar basal-body rod protein FlgB [Paenibacillus cellulosilyticus]|uniref:Flagellar basal body rod protein FlgB n=1 Tax=Paenibacillus cellulosilyticus TaxID=375489 RepID=A0A2V2Z1B3_9BACL|nr:flagellar basal body rod protein FlgB [Paenibacillus cellulosilyticus]PWW06389.1 flagellar basal-body rod protein FlgB [Paenibacillus cellulosilyticus]QKS46635.1 flagellar basal body rod protein FlgB [Paenibacillus cellulosilyticus]